MALSGNSLVNYYYTNFNMAQRGNFSISEIEGWFPFEREIYFGLLQQKIKEEMEDVE